MVRWAVTIAIVALAATARATDARSTRDPVTFDFTRACLAVGSEINGPDRASHALAEIDRMADELSDQLEGVDDHQSIVDTLNNYVFHQEKFRRRPGRGRLLARGLFLDDVLHYRRGQCVGMSMLYLSLADRLELPIYGVSVPDHFFVRYETEGFRRNIDPTLGGRSLPDRYYIRTKNIPEPEIGATYLRSLKPAESLGYLLHMRGVLKTSAGDFTGAISDHDAAQRLFEIGDPSAARNMAAVSMNFKGDVHAARAEETTERDDPSRTLEEEEMALELYHKAIELDRHFGPSYLNRAFVFRSRGDLDSAIFECTRALEVNPEYLRAYFWRATYYFMDGRYRESLADFQRLEAEGVDSPYYDIATEYIATLRELI